MEQSSSELPKAKVENYKGRDGIFEIQILERKNREYPFRSFFTLFRFIHVPCQLGGRSGSGNRKLWTKHWWAIIQWVFFSFLFLFFRLNKTGVNSIVWATHSHCYHKITVDLFTEYFIKASFHSFGERTTILLSIRNWNHPKNDGKVRKNSEPLQFTFMYTKIKFCISYLVEEFWLRIWKSSLFVWFGFDLFYSGGESQIMLKSRLFCWTLNSYRSGTFLYTKYK